MHSPCQTLRRTRNKNASRSPATTYVLEKKVGAVFTGFGKLTTLVRLPHTIHVISLQKRPQTRPSRPVHHSSGGITSVVSPSARGCAGSACGKSGGRPRGGGPARQAAKVTSQARIGQTLRQRSPTRRASPVDDWVREGRNVRVRVHRLGVRQKWLRRPGPFTLRQRSPTRRASPAVDSTREQATASTPLQRRLNSAATPGRRPTPKAADRPPKKK